MLVSQILKSKDTGVVTIAPGATLRDVVELLATRRIGAVVVSSDGKKVKGIVSERDVVRELGRAGPACLDQVVDKVMTRASLWLRRHRHRRLGAGNHDQPPVPPHAGDGRQRDGRLHLDR